MKTVAVIFGGVSPEHDVSLSSGKYIAQSLSTEKFKVIPVGITKSGQWKRIEIKELSNTQLNDPIDLDRVGHEIQFLQKFDNNQHKAGFIVSDQGLQSFEEIHCAFPICHGPYGEDGRLQGFFETLALPYVGSDSSSCVVNLNKSYSKMIIDRHNIPQVSHIVTTNPKVSLDFILQTMVFPLFVKPLNMGSSIGISKVDQESEFHRAIELAFQYDKEVIIEQGAKVREVEISLIEDESGILTSEPCEIIPQHDFYSYEAKYLDPKGAEYCYPAPLDAKVNTFLKKTATQAFQALGCRDYARVDFFITGNNHVYFNEINTHPGFTPISQFPVLWNKEGLKTQDLLEKLITRALSRTLRQSFT